MRVARTHNEQSISCLFPFVSGSRVSVREPKRDTRWRGIRRMKAQDDLIRTTGNVACRIGPLKLQARSASGALVLASPLDRKNGCAGALADFSDAGKSTPALDLCVENAVSLLKPEGVPAFVHRTGWEVFLDGDRVTAIKAIPFGSDRVLRRVEFGLDGGTGRLWVSPEDDRPSCPFAYTFSELAALLLTRVSRALLVHSACIEYGGWAWLFAGRSGAGKSTLAGLWQASGQGRVLGDESHLMWRDETGKIRVCGTPWPGSSGLYANRSALLGGVFFLEHAPENGVEVRRPGDAMTGLLSHAFLPSWDGNSLSVALDVAQQAVESVPCARFSFLPDLSAVSDLRGWIEKGTGGVSGGNL